MSYWYIKNKGMTEFIRRDACNQDTKIAFAHILGKTHFHHRILCICCSICYDNSNKYTRVSDWSGLPHYSFLKESLFFFQGFAKMAHFTLFLLFFSVSLFFYSFFPRNALKSSDLIISKFSPHLRRGTSKETSSILSSHLTALMSMLEWIQTTYTW